MTGPAADIGRRLKAARLRAGASQAEVALHLGVTQTAVSYWEAGRRLPGVDQLMSLSGYLDVPLTDLLPDPASRRPVGAALRAVAEQIDNAQLANALDRFAEAASGIFPPRAELATRSAGPRDAAEQILEAAGLLEELPVDVDLIAKRCGVRVLAFNFSGMVDGLVVQLPDGPAIGLDQSGSANHQRRRFTLAHELGHHLLRHSASFHVDFGDPVGGAGEPPGYNWRHERAANEFAANLLMPAQLVRREHASGADAEHLARRFEVSRQAMGFRLAALGLRDDLLE